ncbi:hypothetical protein ACEN2T_17960 [Pseudomonas sp. W22_MBD1_FP4]|uniref:hypothetical protein n=1 Tax=Pseudomonas sp. W22_MBD1_FP4 TaxID=3240272 RepID=UPI003F94ECDA
MRKISTKVFELPEDDTARTKFLDGIQTLLAECNAVEVSGSVHDEMAYADKLEEELTERIGDMAVESIRQEFEREARIQNPSTTCEQLAP